MARQLDGSAYLVVKPGRYGTIVVDKATNKKPRVTPEGSVVLHIKLRVPSSVFEPIEPEATIVIPEALVDRRSEVSVEATDQQS